MAYLEDLIDYGIKNCANDIALLDKTCNMLGLAPTYQIFYDEHTGTDGWNVPYSKEVYNQFIEQISIGEHEKKYNGADRRYVVWIIMTYFGVKRVLFDYLTGDMASDCAWININEMMECAAVSHDHIGKSSLSGRDRIIHPNVRHNIKMMLELQKEHPGACFAVPSILAN